MHLRHKVRNAPDLSRFSRWGISIAINFWNHTGDPGGTSSIPDTSGAPDKHLTVREGHWKHGTSEKSDFLAKKQAQGVLISRETGDLLPACEKLFQPNSCLGDIPAGHYSSDQVEVCIQQIKYWQSIDKRQNSDWLKFQFNSIWELGCTATKWYEMKIVSIQIQ